MVFEFFKQKITQPPENGDKNGPSQSNQCHYFPKETMGDDFNLDDHVSNPEIHINTPTMDPASRWSPFSQTVKKRVFFVLTP